MSAPPAFQFYAADFLASTAGMSCAEVGAYLRLLLFQWEHGGIPDDAQVIRRVIGSTPSSATTLWRSLNHKFKKWDSDGLWRNARLERVRSEQKGYEGVSRKGGKARAETAQRVNGKFAPAGWPTAGPADDQREPALRSPISDLRSPDRTSIDRGTSPSLGCVDQRTTADSSSAPVENQPTALVDGDRAFVIQPNLLRPGGDEPSARETL